MAISFNRMPIRNRVPGTSIEINNARASQGQLVMPSRVLHLGQMLASGTATPGELVRVTSYRLALQLFSRGSQLAAMARVHFAARPFIDLYALPALDAEAGTSAKRTITVAASPTAAGTLYLYVGARRYSIGVASDDEVGDVATAIAAAISEDSDSYMTATADAATVTLTARHDGIDAGTFDVQHSYFRGEALPDGLALTIAAPTAGTGNPDVQPLLDALGDEWFQTFVMGWTDAANLRALEAELDSRFGPDRQIEGHAYAATGGSVSTVATAGEARNSPHLTLADAGVTIAPAWLLAAADAAIDAAEGDPARPRQTLTLPSELLPVRETQRRAWTERNILLYSGIATHTVDAADIIAIERLITTYQTGNQGIEDDSYLDVCTLRTVAFMRYDIRRMVALKYPRHKLAGNDVTVAPGQAIVTPNIMRGELITLAMKWRDDDGILENLEQFKAELVVERDGDPNALAAVIPPDCINQLRQFKGRLDFLV